MKRCWIQLRNVSNARVLLILPCNAAACVGNYFKAEIYSRRGCNTWREADASLHDLREKGQVAFAAIDSSTLETQPADSRGAVVLETETLVKGVRRIEGMGFSQVLTLVNPRAYFLSLAVAAEKCGLLDRWVVFH